MSQVLVAGGDGIDFKSGTGSSLRNLAGGHIEASRHAVTGERACPW